MNGLTDIAGIRVGHLSDFDAITGCTAILCEQGAVGGVDIRGSASGTQEIDTLSPGHVADQVHGILFSGGSAFGLEAAAGVRRYLAGRKVGYLFGGQHIPIVPGAILFDLGIGKSSVHPNAAMGEAAAAAATADPVKEGSVGAGTGATVGKLFGMARAMKGGIGSYTVSLPGGVLVSALVAVNALGDVRDPATGKIIAGARKSHLSREFIDSDAEMLRGAVIGAVTGNTTLAVVATNARLNKVQANKLAQFASLGMARTIYPVNTMADGDVAFALSLGAQQADINNLGVAAAEAVAQSILRAVRMATSLGGVPPGAASDPVRRLLLVVSSALAALSAQPAPTRADLLRGAYGTYRANNDLLYYRLDVRVDPERKFLSGRNTIRFKMLQDGTRIQLDLHAALNVDKIVLGDTVLRYERDSGAVFVDFPQTLRAGSTYSIDFHYSGNPVETGRFGAITFKKDPSGHSWINTACEESGASVWWPNKDQWRDEVERMEISVSIPNDLVDVSNGKFMGKTDLGDGYTRWDWLVQYPINNYSVSLNIGNYQHFADRLGDLPLDFYVLPESLEKAKKQFVQARGMLEAYQHYFGEYPFQKDGYKLIEAPYSGMEHQSAVTYGNRFANGYLERDWTGVGISPRFDFIIIHESGHEWFGNSVSAADRSDMWIHEGFTTYLECLYVEYMWGRDDGLKYTNGYKAKVRNQQPIIAPRGENRTPPQDQYFKGALFLNTLRSVVNDDARWWALLRDFYQRFKYRNIMTEDVVAYFDQQTGTDLTPVFDQYLRHTALPVLELKWNQPVGTVSYRWKADEPGFRMPIRAGARDHWQILQPTAEWQTLETPLTRDEFEVATDLYFVAVSKL